MILYVCILIGLRQTETTWMFDGFCQRSAKNCFALFISSPGIVWNLKAYHSIKLTTHWFIVIKLIPFEICLFHKPTHIHNKNKKPLSISSHNWFEWNESYNKIYRKSKKTHKQKIRGRSKQRKSTTAVFQNVMIQILYAVLLLYINYVGMQSKETMHQL